MITCPNCNHPNPEGANQCEACYTPLPSTTDCPNCGAEVQADATFCGQCGFNLEPMTGSGDLDEYEIELEKEQEIPATVVSQPGVSSPPLSPPIASSPPVTPPEASQPSPPPPPVTPPEVSQPSPPPPPSTPPSQKQSATTQLQIQQAQLFHVQTNTAIELPQGLSVIHIGKPNDQIPPDIDVSGFPNSDVVSRIHADIRVEGDAHYLEDVGSSNGTYVNHTALPPGNRHRLRPGDRIALGKGDLVTFIFQLS